VDRGGKGKKEESLTSWAEKVAKVNKIAKAKAEAKMIVNEK